MLPAETVFLFGTFRLAPAERTLYNSQGPVRLHGRAFDLLLALLERPGEVIGKDELIARVWPQTCVEEGNLRVHIAALRKALHDGSGMHYVDNVVGRGYTLVAPVRRVGMAASPVAAAAAPLAAHAGGGAAESAMDGGAGVAPALAPPWLPAPPPRLFGRDDSLQRLDELLAQGRLVTVAGPGGMGKTSVALAVAARQPEHVRVTVLDMAPLADAAQLGGALAQALGVPALSHDPVQGLAAHLRHMPALLLFDNCEHLIDAAAALAERLLRETAAVRILATSREPLRAAGECVYRLPPLALPSLPDGMDGMGGRPAQPDYVAALAASPAVQLFAERAASGMDGFRLTPDNAACVADICRRLDGIPLAIELAAGRAEFFGVQGLAARLEDCFAVLTRGRRTALPRHQTLRATLDWSHDMLPPLEQAILRRFAVFRAPFSLDCAVDVVRCEQVDSDCIIDGIANLAAKSLLAVDSGGHETLYRLLDTTRAYALDKLRASGEQDWVLQRHARRYCAVMEEAQRVFDDMPLPQWLERYGRNIGHLRAALDWTLEQAAEAPGVEHGAPPCGNDGAPDAGADPAAAFVLGLRLCAASATMWYQLSLMDEYRRRLEQAMRRVASGALRIDADTEMRLQLAMGHALVHVGGQADSRRRADAFARALSLAERQDDVPARMAALWGCYTDAIFGGDYQAALTYAERYGAAAAYSGELAKVGHARMLARSMHYLGHQQRARAHVEYVARHPLSHRRHALHRGFQFDQHISTLAIHGRVLWLQGYPAQAAQVAQQCVADAMRVGHGISLCFALLLGCTLATWSGDLPAAARYTGQMREHSQRCALPHWQFWGEGFSIAQRLLQDGGDGSDEEAALRALHASPYCGDLQVDVMATLHPRLLSARAIERADAGVAGWCSAEVLRSWGETLWREGSPEQAGQLFQRALAIAREQGAGAWELRAATSLARLRQSQGRAGEGMAPLRDIYGRFTEGLETRDLTLARAVLLGLDGGN